MNNNVKTVQRQPLTAREIFMRYGAGIALALLLLINICITRNFLSLNTLWLIVRQATPPLFMAIGMTLVISSGGIDISTGSMMAFAGFIVAKGITSGGNFWLFTILALIACGLVGAFSGFLIGKCKVQPVILTLVMQIVMRGVTVMLAQSNVFPLDRKTLYPEVNLLGVYRFPGDARVPIQLVFFIAVIIIGIILVQKTVLGKRIEAIGGNERAARLSGINTVRVITIVYVLSAVFAACCGILTMCRNAALDPNELGTNYEMDAIAAVAVGGTSMKGGEGSMVGTLIGIFIIGVIANGLNLLGVAQGPQRMVKGLIIVVAVIIDVLRRRAAESAR